MKLLFLTVILILTAVIDWKKLIIPNSLVLAVALAAVWAWLTEETPSLADRVAGSLIISVPMTALNCVVKNCFGFGDVKLCMASGFLLGIKGMLSAMFLAVFAGGIYAVALLIKDRKNRGKKIPFGPFLAVGIWTARVFGNGIIDWYIGMLRGGW